MRRKKKDKISIIMPCYNEEKSLPLIMPKLHKVFKDLKDVDFEIIFVNNQSTDNTLKLMKNYCKDDKRCHYISFSRNFGKDSSMYAGLKYSSGDFLTIIDADGQDPPELIVEMYHTLLNSDYDCVAAYRKNRKGEPFLRSVLADKFYNIMSKISDTSVVNGARDFRLMTRQMAEAVLSLDESERYTKGIFAFVGFKTKWLSYENIERMVGDTKQPMSVAFAYAIRGIVSFSTAPLYITSVLGFIFCIISVLYAIFVLFKQLVMHEAVPGYPSIICIMMFSFGMLFFVLGIIGQYIATMYREIKHRPKYIIKETDMK